MATFSARRGERATHGLGYPTSAAWSGGLDLLRALAGFGVVLRSGPRIWGARARTTSPGGHVCARDHLIQSVTGRTTGGFPLLQLWRPKALEHCDGKPTGVAGYDG